MNAFPLDTTFDILKALNVYKHLNADNAPKYISLFPHSSYKWIFHDWLSTSAEK